MTGLSAKHIVNVHRLPSEAVTQRPESLDELDIQYILPAI